jgi:hypothetical protein
MHTVGVIHSGAGLDTKQYFVGGRILSLDIVHVIGGNERNVHFMGELDQALVDRFQFWLAGVTLELQVKVIMAKDFLIPVDRVSCRVYLTFAQVDRDFSRAAGTQSRDALAVTL